MLYTYRRFLQKDPFIGSPLDNYTITTTILLLLNIVGWVGPYIYWLWVSNPPITLILIGIILMLIGCIITLVMTGVFLDKLLGEITINNRTITFKHIMRYRRRVIASIDTIWVDLKKYETEDPSTLDMDQLFIYMLNIIINDEIGQYEFYVKYKSELMNLEKLNNVAFSNREYSQMRDNIMNYLTGFDRYPQVSYYFSCIKD